MKHLSTTVQMKLNIGNYCSVEIVSLTNISIFIFNFTKFNNVKTIYHTTGGPDTKNMKHNIKQTILAKRKLVVITRLELHVKWNMAMSKLNPSIYRYSFAYPIVIGTHVCLIQKKFFIYISSIKTEMIVCLLALKKSQTCT